MSSSKDSSYLWLYNRSPYLLKVDVPGRHRTKV